MHISVQRSVTEKRNDSDAIDKIKLEEAMRDDPSNWRLRQVYFDLLDRISVGTTGLGWAVLPELGHPLFFRRGSSDLTNMAEIFLHHRYDVALRATPYQILDLGAFAGYAAVYFATRYPDAEIRCAEPLAANFRLLLLNTIPYRQIACENLAVWGHPVRLFSPDIQGGDAGVRLTDGVGRGGIACDAVTVASLLQLFGWARVELLKCDINGGEVSVFADPRATWLDTIDTLLVACRDVSMHNSIDVVSACFAANHFEHARHRDIYHFERKVPFRSTLTPAPPKIFLIHPGPGRCPMLVQDVDPVPEGFFIFGGTSCQLRPNLFGNSAPARVIFPRMLSGHSRALATLVHAGVQGQPVRFTMRVQTADGHVVAESSALLVEGAQQDIELKFEPAFGHYCVILQTEIEPGAANSNNALARWLEPRLV